MTAFRYVDFFTPRRLSARLHPLNNGPGEELRHVVFVEEKLAPTAFQKRQAMRHAARDVCCHQYELNVALSIFPSAVVPKITECHRLVERTGSQALKEFMQPISQRKNASRIRIAVARARTQAVTIFWKLEEDV